MNKNERELLDAFRGCDPAYQNIVMLLTKQCADRTKSGHDPLKHLSSELPSRPFQ